MKHTNTRWQGSTDGGTRLWARHGQENAIIADFSQSSVLRHETKVANARYAKAAVNFCQGTSVEEIERMIAQGLDLADIRTTLADMRAEIEDLRAQLPSSRLDEKLDDPRHGQAKHINKG